MNTKVIGAIVVVLLLVGGGFYFLNKAKAPAPQTATTQPTQKPAGIFSSIKDALSKSITLQCAFSDESGRQINSYIKNGQVRADIVASDPKQSGSVIIKSNVMYFWNGKQGFTFVMPTAAPTGTTQTAPSTGSSNNQGQNVLDSLEKYKDSCKPAVLADSLFTPPADVVFQDMSKFVPPTSPTGSAGGYAVPSQYQQQMQQYQQKANQGY